MNNKAAVLSSIAAEPRIQLILDRLAAQGFLGVADLAKQLKLSEMTIRRDFDKLEAEGLIRRTHGGAIAENRTQVELNYRTRQTVCRAEKEKIGRLAAGLVKEGQSLFLDAGTTVLAMVEYLKPVKNLKIVTTSLPVQMELLTTPHSEVFLVGGKVLPLTMSLVGTITQEQIAAMHFDWTFLGTGGIDLARGLTHSTMEEIPIKKAAAASADQVAVLADRTKFGYNALSLVMGLDRVDVIVTDQKAEPLAAQLAKRHAKTRVIGS